MVEYKKSTVNDFLSDIVERKEFNNFRPIEAKFEKLAGFTEEEPPAKLALPGVQLFGAQQFIKNFINPNTPYDRILLKWQVGAGKSKALGAIGNEFAKQYKQRSNLGEKTPSIFVVAFTQEILQNELLKDPIFGFATTDEILRLTALRTSPKEDDKIAYIALLSILRRRLTDRSRGGYYTFYGYKSFANKLFITTNEGEKVKFNIIKYAAGKTLNQSYVSSIDEAIKNGYITINLDLLHSMRGGLLICDEIHNVYNIVEANNYGIAIQYVLDKLGKDAPKLVLMSATPVTGSASEVVDLLNLLAPTDIIQEVAGTPYLSRNELFSKFAVEDAEDNISFTVSKLKPNALEIIEKLSIGRVSFLLDSNLDMYPKRILEGETIQGIPYLKITRCPMSEYQDTAFREERAETEKESDSKGLKVSAYVLNDMVFPGPDGKLLYDTNDIVPTYLRNSKWCEENKIVIEKIPNYGMVISGPFLHLENLGKYSSKYARMVKDIIDCVKNDFGKIMIYHNRVRLSGILIIQEILRMNGFLDEHSPPNDYSLCGVCGEIRKMHNESKTTYNSDEDLYKLYKEKPKDHQFEPMRFLSISSDLDKATIAHNKDIFNASSNLYGKNIRILVGSKIIKEGHELKATRHQFVMSFPINYSIAIQVMGRVIRRGSHIGLPKEAWQCYIKFYATTLKDNGVSPELKQYYDKGMEYLVIQEISRVMEARAVDAPFNYEKIQKVLELDGEINSLHYKPIITNAGEPNKFVTFNAYFGETEIEIIEKIILVLFSVRTIWKYDDLVKSLHEVKNINYRNYDLKNVAIALHRCKRPVDGYKIIHIGGQYYMRLRDGEIPDVDCFLRQRAHTESTSINLTERLDVAFFERNFNLRLKDLNKFLEESKNLDLLMTEFIDKFHYLLMKKLIENHNSSKAAKPITIDDKKVMNIYHHFKVMIFNKDGPIGYVTNVSVELYEGGKWINKTHAEYNIGKRTHENSVVGIIENNKLNSMLQGTVFKIKKISKDKTSKTLDLRLVAKGMACTSYSKEELVSFEKSLSRKYGSAESDSESNKCDDCDESNKCDECDDSAPDLSIESKKLMNESTTSICEKIKILLLELEKEARKESMMDSTRYMYLFNDK